MFNLALICLFSVPFCLAVDALANRYWKRYARMNDPMYNDLKKE